MKFSILIFLCLLGVIESQATVYNAYVCGCAYDQITRRYYGYRSIRYNGNGTPIITKLFTMQQNQTPKECTDQFNYLLKSGYTECHYGP